MRTELVAAFNEWWPLAIMLGIAAWLGRIRFRPPQRRPSQVLYVVFGSLFMVVFATVQFVDRELRWGWLLACLPGAIIAVHAINLAVRRNPYFFQPRVRDHHGVMVAPEHARLMERLTDENKNVEKVMRSAAAKDMQDYATEALTLRFGLPGLILVGSCLMVFGALAPTDVNVELLGLPVTFVKAARYGAVGAYCYVIIYLSRRLLEQDITSGSIIWTASTMAMGPVLAAVVQALWHDGTSAEPSPLLSFAAGFALRPVAAALTTSIQRVLTQNGGAAEGSRAIALTRIRGITQEIAERLQEEGVHDIVGLALADPNRLRRGTRFDRRLIVGWMDEALLMYMVPDAWEAMEREGISGVIDLAWMARASDSELAPLATAAKMDPVLLRAMCLRLAQDAQVTLLWGLWQLGGLETEAGGLDLDLGTNLPANDQKNAA